MMYEEGFGRVAIPRSTGNETVDYYPNELEVVVADKPQKVPSMPPLPIPARSVIKVFVSSITKPFASELMKRVTKPQHPIPERKRSMKKLFPFHFFQRADINRPRSKNPRLLLTLKRVPRRPMKKLQLMVRLKNSPMRKEQRRLQTRRKLRHGWKVNHWPVNTHLWMTMTKEVKIILSMRLWCPATLLG